ncbi:MAG: phenylacetate-CoA oxygenase subunit PaaC [Chitinophagaceae bacterium]|nr:phenylacetate-CoA oxygenase subunit PaaC [Chitinophagaceae bacterium]
MASLPYLLHLADNALILGHRNSEWCGHGPVLEQDIAITNISLDLIGQARNLYQLAAPLAGPEATEDSLAFLRDGREFRNCLLVELPKGNWAVTVLRQFFFSNYQSLLYGQLQQSSSAALAAVAEKAAKEVAYHLRWSSEWVIRLGDGTEESHEKISEALTALWPYTGELFTPAAYEDIKSIGFAVEDLRTPWLQTTAEVLQEATLEMPPTGWSQQGGKEGIHTEHLGFLLAEMQFLQRAYPQAQW